MKVYSDTLTANDLDWAAKATDRAWIAQCAQMRSPRVRARGWDIQLGELWSRKHRNTGIYGAGEVGAASWDTHGRWMARLFAIDPDARIANYDGAADFHRKTDDAYRLEVQA